MKNPQPPLLHELKRRICLSGPLSVAEYMEACLYHPEHGYYTRGLNFLTQPPQDFLTAPEHTPLFGYTLANWVAKTWQKLGAPTSFTLTECGPGRGTLMHDVLTHLQTTQPDIFQAAHPTLIETSPALIRLQQQTLSPFPQCRWKNSLSDTSLPTRATILLANEFLDAFPIHQYIHTGGKLFEILIDLHPQTEELHFITNETPAPVKIPPGWDPSEGAILELAPQEAPFLEELATHTTAALLIDYGAAILPVQGGNTLQAVHRHQPVDALYLPGECDLTAHINFSSLIRGLGPTHCTLQDLAPFLLENGLAALGLQHPSQQPRLHRLLHPAQMGTLFKVLCYTPSTR